MNLVVGLLLSVGALLMLVAAIGIVRMPDVLLRLSATTKAVTLGAGCSLLAAALHFEDVGAVARVLATIVFLAATAPIAAHMIGRGAYFSKTPLWHHTQVDELRLAHDRKTVGRAEGPTDLTRNEAAEGSSAQSPLDESSR